MEQSGKEDHIPQKLQTRWIEHRPRYHSAAETSAEALAELLAAAASSASICSFSSCIIEQISCASLKSALRIACPSGQLPSRPSNRPSVLKLSICASAS